MRLRSAFLILTTVSALATAAGIQAADYYAPQGYLNQPGATVPQGYGTPYQYGYGGYPSYPPQYGNNTQYYGYPGNQAYGQQYPSYNYAQPNYNYYSPYAQNQWRRPPVRRPVQDEPFSLVPWDHLPGGEMPDFNPFSQGPFKRLPSKVFDTPMKDWAVKHFGDVWEDALNAPHNMGRMPGNVQAPAVSIPNPVDLGDQIGESSAVIAEDAPEVIQGWFD